jgi:CRISPR-associated endonuclease Csn1
VVNRLICQLGLPDEVAVELARELKLTDEEKQRKNAENNKNREAAEKRSKKLLEHSIPDTGANRARLKLWEDLNPANCLDRRCPYSGQQISINMLFSEAVDIDHILPFAQTLDDSNANKTVCLSGANKLKRNRSPYEAAADFEGRYGDDGSWEAIAARAALMPNKRKRFAPDAMEKFRKEDGFLARQLTDTQYLSRLARDYLSALYPDKGEGSSHVWVSPGRLTEMVRRKLGLNDLLPDHNFGGGAGQPKNRLDHRHHAIDAVVIALVDRSMLQAIARASGEEGVDGRERIIIPDPWNGFRDDLRNVVNAIVVSHRPDHGTTAKMDKTRDGTAGRLHNDTAYGLTGEKNAKGNDIVVHRVPLSSLTKREHIETVRDETLRLALLAWTDGLDGKAFEEKLRKFLDLGPLPFRNIRRLRVVEPLSVIPIRDRNGRAYKGYKGDSNYRYDVWELKDGKWVAEVVSMFDAHQPGWTSTIRQQNPTAKKVLELHQDDLLAITKNDQVSILVRVVKFGQNGQITLAEPQEAGDLKRRDAVAEDVDPFKYFSPTAGGLKKAQARQVRIDELGRVLDPGFPARKRIRKTRPK